MMEVVSSPWIPTLVLLLVACGARLYCGSWLPPGAFALGVWFVYVAVPLMVAPKYKVSSLAVWIILSLVLCISIGALVGEGQVGRGQGARGIDPVLVSRMLRLSLLFSGFGLLGVLIAARMALREYSLDFSVMGILSLGHLLSVARYSGEQSPFLVRLLLTWIFPAALLGGMSYPAVNTRLERLMCFTSLVPAVLCSAINATRANTVIALVMGVSGYLAVKLVTTSTANRIVATRTTLLMAASAVVGLVLLFIAVDVLRTHEEAQDFQMATDWDRAQSSSVGYLAAFSEWVEGPEGPDSLRLSLGAYTFGGLLDMGGLRSRQTGIYAQSMYLDGVDLNIFTAFRGLIEDVSLPGAAIVCLLLGLLTGRSYRRYSNGCKTGVIGVVVFFAFILFSPICSVFFYNGPVLAILVGLLALRESAISPSTARLARQGIGTV